MSLERARQLAAELEAANLELIQVVGGCSDEQWHSVCNDEGESRTIGVVAHHVAHGHLYTAEWIDTALAGKEVTITLDDINLENAEHATTYHDVERAETSRLLAVNGKFLAGKIAALGDDQLAKSSHHRGAGREMTVEAFAQLGRRHVMNHLATIRRGLGLDPA